MNVAKLIKRVHDWSNNAILGLRQPGGKQMTSTPVPKRARWENKFAARLREHHRRTAIEEPASPSAHAFQGAKAPGNDYQPDRGSVLTGLRVTLTQGLTRIRQPPR